jgi:hypothetical protein
MVAEIIAFRQRALKLAPTVERVIHFEMTKHYLDIGMCK